MRVFETPVIVTTGSPITPRFHTLAVEVRIVYCAAPLPSVAIFATQGSGLAVPGEPLQVGSAAGDPPLSVRKIVTLVAVAPFNSDGSAVNTSCSGWSGVPSGAETDTCSPSSANPVGANVVTAPSAIPTSPPVVVVIADVIGLLGLGPVFDGSVVAVPAAGNVCETVSGVGAPDCGVTGLDGSDALPDPAAVDAVTVKVYG